MILNQEMVQKFVQQIIENLGHNVNIMDEHGIIIASGYEERIGTFHEIASEVIKKGRRIDIDKTNARFYEGVEEGINLPFFYKDTIAGVVGITGDPKAIENVAQMVKMTVELMLEQEHLKECMYSHLSQKNFFVNQLFSINSEEELITVTNWANKLGYDLTKKRIVCLMSINEILKEDSGSLLYSNGKVKDHIVKIISSSPYHEKQDIVIFTSIDQVMIIKTVKRTSKKEVVEEITRYLQPIYAEIKSYLGKEPVTGVGTFYKKLEHLKESYLEAKSMLNIGKALLLNENIIFAYEYFTEHLLSSISMTKLSHYLEEYASKIKDKPELVETLESLIRNNMNVLKTSKELFVHRNTILFRINKIKEMFGIDPIHKDQDRNILRLLCLYLKMNK